MPIIVNIISGVYIKILLISNVEGGTDQLLAYLDLEGVTVISKEVAADAKGLAKYAADLYANGNFDYVIAVPNNAVSANIAFNKYDGFTAAVCSDVDDARAAKSGGVNVILIKTVDENSGAIVAAAIKGGGAMGSMKLKMPTMPKLQPQQQKQMPAAPQQQIPQQPAKQLTVKKKVMKPTPENLEPDEQQKPKKPGVKGWLKYTFGIGDKDEK